MKPFRILYMEDNAFFSQLLSQDLQKGGYSVSIAKDGEEGMAILAKENFDLILLDLLMPKMDGFEVLGRIKKDPKLNSIPIIVLSNLGDQEDLNRAKDMGAEVFLVKAMSTPKDIVAAVDQLLDQ